MADIIDLIGADHLHIMRWAARLGELSRQGDGHVSRSALVTTWKTLATLIDLHMSADEEVCGPAVFGSDPQGPALARQIEDAHEDIREIIRETNLQRPGSLPWWHLVKTTLAAWAVQLDEEAHGPMADRRRRADPALRAQLADQWRAFADALIRDQYPQAPPEIPTHQLRQNGRAPVAMPRLADPAFGPLACTCRACNRTLDWLILQQRKHLRDNR
jgi:hypothetical protein